MVKRTRLLWISLLLIPLLRVALGTAPANLEAQLDLLLPPAPHNIIVFRGSQTGWP